MKGVTVCMCVIIAIVSARECIYDDRGLCIEDCPPGTVSFTSTCDTDHGPVWSSPTCEKPIPENVAGLCDMSWCGCVDKTLFWDDVKKACVKRKYCSKKNAGTPSDRI